MDGRTGHQAAAMPLTLGGRGGGRDRGRAVGLRGPTSYLLPIVAGAALVVVVLVVVLLPSPTDRAEPAEGVPAGGRAAEPPAAPEAIPAPPWPARAWDDFRYGLHLRYPVAWEDRSSDALPPGLPGSLVLAVGPPGRDAALAVHYVGVLVPRAGIEAIARRSAALVGNEVIESGWVVLAGREAFRVRSKGGGRREEATFFSHRHVLFALRAIVGPGAEDVLPVLSDVGARLTLD